MSNFEQDLKKVLLEQRIKDAQRAKIIQEALKPLEEDVAETSEEQIDEISKNTLGSYVKKANQNSNDMSDLRGSVGTDSPRYSKLNKIVKR